MDQIYVYPVMLNYIDLIKQLINLVNVLLEDMTLGWQHVKFVVPFVKHVVVMLLHARVVKLHNLDHW